MVILYDVFDDETRQAFIDFNYERPEDGDEKFYHLGTNPYHEKVIDIAREYFDLSEAIGYEMWCNLSQLHMHQDKDERKIEKGILSLPLCSIVYYPLVNIVSGGKFITDCLNYTPKQNSLIIFTSSIFHMSSFYNGKRMAIAINPFTYNTNEGI